MDYSFITRIVTAGLRLRPACTQIIASTFRGRVYVEASNGRRTNWHFGQA